MSRLQKYSLWLVVGVCVLTAVIAGVSMYSRKILPYGLLFLDVGETPRKSDAIFLLLGDTDVRPFVAAALYNAGFADEIILSKHGSANLHGEQHWRPSHEIARRVLLQRGVPEHALRIIGDGSQNTMNESEALRAYFQTHPHGAVTVVTSHYHTRRTRWSLRKQLGEHARQLRFVSAPDDDFDATNWWRSMSGFESVMMEYLKIGIYWFFYGSAVSVLTIVAAVLGVAVWWRWRRCYLVSREKCTVAPLDAV